jgi:CheY-like chemotaxis protein
LRMKILLAEDDASIQLIAKMSLQKIGGHEVVVANNGKEALDKACEEKFDLIILDGMMPEMDGFQTCLALKSSPKTSDMPVIFLTAKNQQSDIDEGFKIGGIGYIVKPFDAKELCKEIDKIFNKILWKKSA